MIGQILKRFKLKREKLAHTHLMDKNYHEVFEYEFIPTFRKETDDYMIRFGTAKNVNHLFGKLLMIMDQLKFDADGTNEMIEEIWINAKSSNGRITITRDIWDFVFILAENNKTDLERIDAALNTSTDFKKIAIEK